MQATYNHESRQQPLIGMTGRSQSAMTEGRHGKPPDLYNVGGAWARNG
jgi:hypothetical protein